MAFIRDNFSPAFISGTKTIRLFVYANEEDLLAEIMTTGYFNSQRIMLHPKSMIDVIAKDHIARIIVGPQEGLNVTMRSEHFRASDPYAEMIKPKPRRVRRSPAQMKADKALAKTG